MTLRDWNMVVYLTVFYRSLEHQQLVEEDDNERFDLPEDEIYNGFKRYSQDEVSSEGDAGGF
jgi:hypothetical protein